MSTSGGIEPNGTVVDEGDVEIAVPEEFKLLVRHVVKTFYSKEAYLVVDMIIHKPLIKEDKLIELLHFDRKVLRTALNDLRKESLIRDRLTVETDDDGKTTRQHCYSIAFRNFLSVVKYKLDQMRVRIAAQERAAIRRTSFQCPSCNRHYSDLELGHLLDMASGKLLCTFCGSEVTEETAGDSDQPDARQLMTMFNTQLAPLFELLQKCETARQEMQEMNQDNAALARDAFLRNNSIPGRMPNLQPPSAEVRVSIIPAGHNPEAAVKAPREQPSWMTASVAPAAPAPSTTNPTLDDVEALFGVKLDVEDMGASSVQTPDEDLFGVKHEPQPWLSEPSPPNGSKASSNEDAEAVLRTLLDHEKMEQGSNTSDEFIDVKDEKSEPSQPADKTAETSLVSVAGTMVPYADVSDDMIRQMTESERQEYIRIGTELYSDLYD